MGAAPVVPAEFPEGDQGHGRCEPPAAGRFSPASLRTVFLGPGRRFLLPCRLPVREVARGRLFVVRAAEATAPPPSGPPPAPMSVESD